MVADKVPAMSGRETLTTVVSSTSIKVQNMTEIAITHGLIWRTGWAAVISPVAVMLSRITVRKRLDGWVAYN